MEIFDLGIAWDSQPDNEFVAELNTRALKYGLKPYLIHAYNFYGSLKDIADDKVFFRFFLDRTLQNTQAFNGLAPFLKKKGSVFINHPDNAKKSVDKTVIHKEFLNHAIPVPKTFFLNGNIGHDNWELKLRGITPELFVFKSINPANGNEEISDINCLKDILRLKEQNAASNCIIQEKIFPRKLEDKPACFRILYCMGEIIPCWWHPINRNYKILTMEEAEKFGLLRIWKITRQIVKACKLSFFSTEIILRDNNKFIVVNYTYDKPDMRRQSKFSDGIPDEIVDKVIEKCCLFTKKT